MGLFYWIRGCAATTVGITTALVPASGALAQVATITINAENYSERDLSLSSQDDGEPTIRVSLPGSVAGVTGGSDSKRGGFPDLFVNGIGPYDKQICVSLASADGFYEAYGTALLDPSARRAGVARIVFPTRVRRFAEGFDDEVAAFVRASASEGSCPRDSAVLATNWGQPASGRTAGLKLLVGGEGRLSRPEVRYADQNSATLCQPLTDRGRSRAGYRWVCTPSESTCEPERDVVITWRRGTRRQPGFRFTLRRTCF